jgi:hypothetical protein
LADVRPVFALGGRGGTAKRSVNAIYDACYEGSDRWRSGWSSNGSLIGVIIGFIGLDEICEQTHANRGYLRVAFRAAGAGAAHFAAGAGCGESTPDAGGGLRRDEWFLGSIFGGAADFFECAREAGLQADDRYHAKFSASELATVSVNFFTALAGASGPELVASSAASRV